MMVVIKTKNQSRDICYVTRLFPDYMGNFDDLRQQVTEANKTGETMRSTSMEIQFSVTSVTADVAMLGEKAAAMCDGISIVWLQMQKGTIL